MALPLPVSGDISAIHPWRAHYGDAFFLVWAADAEAARDHVERFGYTVTSVEPATSSRGAPGEARGREGSAGT